MSGAGPRASCRGLFRKIQILPAPCQSILSLMLIIIDNSNNFQTSLEIHGLHTRCKNQLSFQLQTSQVFKKELHILLLKYITVCLTVF
jgi:hypothetical protein